MNLTKSEIDAGLAYCRWLHMRAFNSWMRAEMAKIGATSRATNTVVCLNGVGERVYNQVLEVVRANHVGGVMLREGERKAVVKYLAELKDGRRRRPVAAATGHAVKRAGVHLTSVRKFVGSTGTRRISGIASSISVDRQGDVVVPSGGRWRLPVPLLWQHSHRDPLGKVTRVELRGSQLWFEAEFAEGVARADEVWRLVEQGALDSVSIGFREVGDPARLPSGGRRWDSWELLEISIVAVGANQDAKLRTPAKSFSGGIRLVKAARR